MQMGLLLTAVVAAVGRQLDLSEAADHGLGLSREGESRACLDREGAKRRWEGGGGECAQEGALGERDRLEMARDEEEAEELLGRGLRGSEGQVGELGGEAAGAGRRVALRE